MGGRRPGAGMPKGYKTRKTLAKEAAREVAQEIITARMHEILDAQIENAIGIRHLMLREPGGKFRRLVSQKDIDRALASNKERLFWIYTKDPSPQSASLMLDRALDKPMEHVETHKTDDAENLKLLKEGQARNARMKKERDAKLAAVKSPFAGKE